MLSQDGDPAPQLRFTWAEGNEQQLGMQVKAITLN